MWAGQPKAGTVNVPVSRIGAGMDEMVAAMRACWGPDPVEYEGRFHRIAASELTRAGPGARADPSRATTPAPEATRGSRWPECGKLLGMDLPSNPPVSPAVRITVLLRLASEGFQDAFGRSPEWLEVPPVDLAELREVVGVERIGQLREATGLREGEGYAAGGPPGVVRLAAAAHEGVLGLLGVAAMPPDVIIEQTPDGPRYHVPEDWFLTTPAADPGRN
jgi:hypothetical protein